MEDWTKALLFGFGSALSLPIGALLGLALEPSEGVVARWMGFGAGCLVYAVATALYGKTLFKLLARSPSDEFSLPVECDDVCEDLWENLNIQISMGLLGAASYQGLNHLMEMCMKKKPPAPESARLSTKDISSLDLRDIGKCGRDAETESTACSDLDFVDFAASEAPEPAAQGNVALSMWLGLVLDGIPESLMLGFMTTGGEITISLLLSIFLANFPEAFAGAALLQKQGMPAWKNFLLWSSVFVLTGVLAMLGSIIIPVSQSDDVWLDEVKSTLTILLEGFTGGAMLAMVATAMMPEAFHGSKGAAGNYFVLGFSVAIFTDGFFARFAALKAED